MMKFKPGELFIYQNGDRYEIGKVKRLNNDGTGYFCWYHNGSTTANTPRECMHKLNNAYVIDYENLGKFWGLYMRFNDFVKILNSEMVYLLKLENVNFETTATYIYLNELMSDVASGRYSDYYVTRLGFYKENVLEIHLKSEGRLMKDNHPEEYYYGF